MHALSPINVHDRFTVVRLCPQYAVLRWLIKLNQIVVNLATTGVFDFTCYLIYIYKYNAYIQYPQSVSEPFGVSCKSCVLNVLCKKNLHYIETLNFNFYRICIKIGRSRTLFVEHVLYATLTRKPKGSGHSLCYCK